MEETNNIENTATPTETKVKRVYQRRVPNEKRKPYTWKTPPELRGKRGPKPKDKPPKVPRVKKTKPPSGRPRGRPRKHPIVEKQPRINKCDWNDPDKRREYIRNLNRENMRKKHGYIRRYNERRSSNVLQSNKQIKIQLDELKQHYLQMREDLLKNII